MYRCTSSELPLICLCPWHSTLFFLNVLLHFPPHFDFEQSKKQTKKQQQQQQTPATRDQIPRNLQ